MSLMCLKLPKLLPKSRDIVPALNAYNDFISYIVLHKFMDN